MRALAIMLIAGAFGIVVGDASAASWVYPPLRFDGGSYDLREEGMGTEVEGPAGTAEYPTFAGGETTATSSTTRRPC